MTSEQLQLQLATRRLLAQRLAELVAQLPEPPAPDAARAVADARDLGWLELGLPESVGGAGGLGELALVHEELGRGLAPSLVTSMTLAARLVLHCTPGRTRDDLLAGLAAGSVTATPALDVFGDQPATGLPVVAVSRGGLRLDGQVSHVVDADTADQLLVAARDGDGRVQLLQVARASPGVHVALQDGFCDLPVATLGFDEVELPGSQRLEGDAVAALRALRVEALLLSAARSVGGGRAVLARTVDHVATRQQFGRAIGTFQAVQHQLATAATALDAAGLAVAQAAAELEAAGAQLAQAPEAALRAVARTAGVAALAAGAAFTDATLMAHQLHGGMGFVLDSPLHLWSARAAGDPTAPGGRARVLDVLSQGLGLTPDAFEVRPHHREAGASTGAA